MEPAGRGRVERRLAAILAADVAGYSRLIGADEGGTLDRLRALRRELLDPKIAEYRGRLVKTTGDGLLVEFGSVVDALRCASEVQREMAGRNTGVPPDNRIELRVGINMGDIVVEDGDIFGDGVNVAARLEGLAEPGGICVAARVQEDAAGKLDLLFEDIGEQHLKNIARPVRAYRVATTPGPVPTRPGTDPPLPDKPSIAVLPFQNMSGDPEQEYFADGIAEDVITLLSKWRSLFVIARNSSFTYKGRAVDVKTVGRELGVRYVLEGSVRKAGNRVRVTGQLIEAGTGGHLWAERYDRDLTDIFEVQDEITASVSAAIFPTMERSERERAARKPTDSLDAWECYYRGMWHFAKFEAEENERARSFFQRAINLDPQFAPAAAASALTYLNEITLFRPDRRGANLPLALDHSTRAVSIDDTDATGHSVLARSLWMSGRHAESLAQAQIAIRCDPNSAAAHGALGGARLWGGFPREAIEPLQTAMRLSPFDPLTPLWRHFIARAHYWSGSYREAIAVARQLRQSHPNFRQPYNTLIASLGQMGDVDEVHAVMADGLARFGEAFRIFLSLPLKELRELRSEDREHLIEGYRKGGLFVE
jgi:adenylate cyclase